MAKSRMIGETIEVAHISSVLPAPQRVRIQTSGRVMTILGPARGQMWNTGILKLHGLHHKDHQSARFMDFLSVAPVGGGNRQEIGGSWKKGVIR